MVLPEPAKARARVHMGVPVLGVQDSGFALGYRFTNVMGLLEFRMNNLQPWEYASITGAPTASAQIQGSPAVGNTVTATINAQSPMIYTVTSGDVAAATPMLSVAENAAAQFSAALGGAIMVTAQPAVSYPTTAIGASPPFWQLAFASMTGQAFTLSMSATGGVYGIATYQGVMPRPSYTFTDDSATAVGYIAICDYLESVTSRASDLSSKFSSADVVEFRRDELAARVSTYDYWRQRLADVFGIPLYPMQPVAAFGGNGTGLIV